MTDGVGKAFLNSGQTCSALTRMVVPRSRLAEVEELAAAAAEAMTPGDPFAKESRLGPLVSQAQWDRVQGYIAEGIDEGAKLVTGGAGKPDGLETGYFVKPTVFSEVRPDMRIAQEEIFGPVLSILPYDTEDEAVEIANDSDYGLAGGVWAGDPEHGHRRRPPDPHRPGRGQRRARSTPTRRSAATSSRASAGSTGTSDWRSSSRSRRCSYSKGGIGRLVRAVRILVSKRTLSHRKPRDPPPAINRQYRTRSPGRTRTRALGKQSHPWATDRGTASTCVSHVAGVGRE